MPTAFNPRRLLLLAAIACAALAVQGAGLLRGIDGFLSAERMALAPRAAGGDIVFLAIDKRALDRVGTWPWPRRVHAEIVARLAELDAAEIYLDVDFGTPSDPDEDAALAHALAASPTAVILPALLQDATVGAAGRDLEPTLPIGALREHAWLASANVRPDPDGRVRRFPYGVSLGSEQVPSIAAMLAGVLGPAGTEFAVDFSIRPETVPAWSVADLLDGTLDPGAVAGRSVLLGAHAAELGDTFSVPVHGVVSGPLMQILAAETLVQGRALGIVSAAWMVPQSARCSRRSGYSVGARGCGPRSAR